VGWSLLLAIPGPVSPAAALIDITRPSVGWRPANGIVKAMVRSGSVVVLGGTFTSMVSVSGSTAPRSGLAALDVTTGALLPWNPDPDGRVDALAPSPDGSTIYVGGEFTRIAGSPRRNLAAVGIPDGRTTGFSADTDAAVETLVHDGRGLLVGGLFSTIRGVVRDRAAEVDPSDGSVRAWSPKVNGGVFAIEPTDNGESVFLGGTFTFIDGAARERLAKVSRSDGSVRPWVSGSTCRRVGNPCNVYDIEDAGETLVLAMGGPGGRVVSLDRATGAQLWWTGADGDMQDVEVDGGKVYAGGHFVDSVNGVPRAGLAALALSTGAVLPELDARVVGGSSIWAVLRDGAVLRFAGQFTSIDGAPIGKYSSFPIIPDPSDEVPPAAPGGLIASAVPDSVVLRWSRAPDNTVATAYRVYRNGQQIATTSRPSVRDDGVAPATPYEYAVSAVDAAGNESPRTALAITTEAAAPVLVPRGRTWRYYVAGKDAAPGWTNPEFADASWPSGVGEFGFGEADEATPVPPQDTAAYFRTSFDVAEPAAVGRPLLRLLVDDGAVIHLNGSEVARVNMPAGPVSADTASAAGFDGQDEIVYRTVALPAAALRKGNNVLAVSVHNDPFSEDLSFDAFVQYTPRPLAVDAGAVWRVEDSGEALKRGWRAGSYSDAGWRVVATEFGFGDGDEATVLARRSPSGRRITTYYARTELVVPGKQQVKSLGLRAVVDDGAALYVNGTEVWRHNLPEGPLAAATRAVEPVTGQDEGRWHRVELPRRVLRPGVNTVAVEVHNRTPGSGDLSWNLRLTPRR
jgi:hypothetical protein